ncbi:hypothetical protein BVAF_377 [Candidatus Blochmanniella vafra str. BVAF]|uniref:Inverse autotransporter beta-domain domain-containing protein n=2 Tax=Candidatus Blochmanniella vafra TaxID=251535 RepID=E8Q676_BLOVB|nr:hypothetical protein BVAF_377 [Candidatus Blochmannia vafer str. BVAF]
MLPMMKICNANNVNAHNAFINSLIPISINSDIDHLYKNEILSNKFIRLINNNKEDINLNNAHKFYLYRMYKNNITNTLQYNYKVLPFFYHYKNDNQFRIQLKNDSINILRVMHKYLWNHIYGTTLSFVQAGIKKTVSKEKIAILGIGKRHVHNNKHVIGCNSFIYFPIFNRQTHPYFLNLGGEYWYNNLVCLFKSYYTINSTPNFYKPFCFYTSYIYPKTGYQICIENKLPYISELKSQIKIEKFIYRKKNNNIFDCINKHHNHCLYINLIYTPIPLLDIKIDNLFIQKKYYDTTCSISLNYQYNIPFQQHINNKQYLYNQSKSIISNNLNAILEPFIPSSKLCMINSTNNYGIIDLSKSNQEITGYPGEIKLIKIIGNNHESNLTWDMQNFYNQGGQMLHVKHDMYAISFPKIPLEKEVYILFSKNENHNCTNNSINHIKQKIKILVNNYAQTTLTSQLNNTLLFNNDNISNNQSTLLSDSTNNLVKSDENHEIYTNTITTHDNNKVINYYYPITEQQKNQDTNDVDVLHDNHNTTTSENSLNKTIDGIQEKSNSNSISLSPPPPPPMPLQLYSTQIETKLLPKKIYNDDSELFLISKSTQPSQLDEKLEKNTDNSTITITNINIPTTSRNNSCIKNDDNYHQLKTNNSNNNLSYLIPMHKQFKFSSINSDEYIKKLENSILERKKLRCTSEMEKILSKLHLSSSFSSIEDSVETNDSSDNFSTSSTNTQNINTKKN